MSGWSELERGVDLDQFNLGADFSQAFPTADIANLLMDRETASVNASADETSAVGAESLILDR